MSVIPLKADIHQRGFARPLSAKKHGEVMGRDFWMVQEILNVATVDRMPASSW